MSDDLTDKKFGALLVLRREKPRWICRCDCGAIIVRSTKQLLINGARACHECSINGKRPGLSKEELTKAKIEAYAKTVKTRTCQCCGKEYEGGILTKYCDKCRPQRKQDQIRAWKRRHKDDNKRQP